MRGALSTFFVLGALALVAVVAIMIITGWWKDVWSILEQIGELLTVRGF